MNVRHLLAALSLSAFAFSCGGGDQAETGGDGGTTGDAAADRASGSQGGASGASVGAGGRSGSAGSIGSASGGRDGGGGGAINAGGAIDSGSGPDGSIGDVSVGGSAGSGGSAGTGGASQVDGSVDASTIDGSPEGGGISCGVFNDPCSNGTTCCSGICDPQSNTCASIVGRCFDNGSRCAGPTDCCSLNCGSDGFCASTPCISDGQSCSTDGGSGACCSAKCNGTTCQALNSSCRTAGNECTTNDQCCSHLCNGGRCSLGGSYCIQTGDACSRGIDCCGGICNIAAGATLGTCEVPAPGATRCSGAVDGSFCNGCGQCCSRLCAPYGATGVFICQPANGCRIDGDLCVRDRDCCGNDNSLPTSGKNVQCVREHPGDPVGLCRNPMGCSPEGNVCHYKQDDNYACNVSSAPNNCCDAPGNSDACQLDALGVPRCHAVGTCRAAGETCAYSGDCCKGVPCVPDGTGQLRCISVPDGGPSCVASGGNCTVTGDCCPGSTCIAPQGSILGKCGTPTPPDGGLTPPPDGGPTPPPDGSAPPPDDASSTDDASPPNDGGVTSDGTSPPPDNVAPPPPVCSQYGQICAMDSDCCNSIPCTSGICRIPPM